MNTPSQQLFHIVRVITWLPPGGIEKRLATILPRLNQSPFRVSVVCLRARGPLADSLEHDGVPVAVVPLRSRLDPRGIRALARWMRSEKVDLVHSHMYRSNVPATIAARVAGIKAVVCQVHNVNTWETWRQRWMDRLLLRWRRAMIAVSDEVKRDIVGNLGCPPDFVRVLYNGIDLREYASVRRDPKLRHQLGIPEGRKLIVVLARLVPQKGHVRLLRALEAARGQLPPAHALFVGDGKMRSALEDAVRNRRLGDMVTFAGYRDDVPQILALADLSVLASDREGFSNAIIESLAAGVPVVATDVGGNSEVIVHGECGLLVALHDAEALGRGIQTVLSDDDLRQRMSNAARRRAERFSLDRMIAETNRLYLTLLGQEQG
ncbi:glycosyltransferase [Candidatus Sumerlaeota bacterium]|nr:glycosyltransferase [Candidatus Sumerlaeota bacterium]